jgi:hypothetical protein
VLVNVYVFADVKINVHVNVIDVQVIRSSIVFINAIPMQLKEPNLIYWFIN